MSRSHSADEVRDRYIAAMGDELGEVFSVLSNEVTLLCWQFDELSELSGGTPKRLELMNRTASFFFWLLQRTWLDETLLGITRLVAPLASSGQANLTIRQLSQLVTDTALKTRVGKMIDVVVMQSAFAGQWRNKRIAHRDRTYALNKAGPLPPVKLKDIEKVLDGIADILNVVDAHYCDSTTLYRNGLITHGVRDLLYVLRDGTRFEDARQKRIDSGEVRPEDWEDGAAAL
jgi:hypothetical protein